MEIHEQLMQHMGGGDLGGDTLIEADYNADGSQAEDEYNPDVRTISPISAPGPGV